MDVGDASVKKGAARKTKAIPAPVLRLLELVSMAQSNCKCEKCEAIRAVWRYYSG